MPPFSHAISASATALGSQGQVFIRYTSSPVLSSSPNPFLPPISRLAYTVCVPYPRICSANAHDWFSSFSLSFSSTPFSSITARLYSFMLRASR